MKEVYIVAYGRSAVCRARKGSFANTHPIEYSAQTLKGVLAKCPQIELEDIEDVIMGCAFPLNETSMNIARLVVNRTGLPDSVCGQTINRFCSSGLQAIASAANAIASDQGDVIVAGGVEDMSHTFMPAAPEYHDQWLEKNYLGAYMSMGITAENVAEKYQISRKEMEAFTVQSHVKAGKAQQEGKFPSIIPVEVKGEDGTAQIVTLDEGIRANTTMESLAGLKPCFKPDGSLTAALSSQTSDAAAFVVLASGEKVKKLRLKPLAKMLSFATIGCDAALMGLGPIYAVPKALKRANKSLKDMDVIELNEAFASQSIACIRDLDMDEKKVNPYGGALALGHPMGATGAFLTCKALDYLKDNNGRYAMITMCVGGGMGAASVMELL